MRAMNKIIAVVTVNDWRGFHCDATEYKRQGTERVLRMASGHVERFEFCARSRLWENKRLGLHIAESKK